jgi:hypothetical protein
MVGRAPGVLGQLQKAQDFKRDDPSTWATGEQIKFMVWCMQTHHPEAAEQFQAVRDIERQIEEEQEREKQSLYWQSVGRYYQQQGDPRAIYGNPVSLQETPKKQGFWQSLFGG